MTSRFLPLLMAILLLGGCAVPRTGPSFGEVTNSDSGLVILPVSTVLEADGQAAVSPQLPAWFDAAPAYASDRLGPGDELRILIAESASNGAFLQTLAAPLTLDGVRVEEDGSIRVAYAGTLDVEGLSASQAAARIAGRLDSILYRPQVQVSLTGSDRRTVTVVGDAGGEQVTLSSGRDSLATVIAASRTALKEDATYAVELRRGDERVSLPYDLVMGDPAYDVALAPGDVVRLARTVSQITVLGSVGRGQLVTLPAGGLSLVQALGAAGGLDGNAADPKGIFLFRPGHGDATAPVAPAIYHMDMRNPLDIVAGSEFALRDGDVVYVSYTSFAQTQKVLRAISGTISVGGSVAQIAR
ncbi:polysaccharide biosynthesis/export family protein [Sphingomicrobium nitratireducens]|uniref:polysaccharide biosynthesis/export family protein n=1 Tax=Sphingomicrobium nitratireducens TaxID=2964666 RepID=UPI00223F68F6|nr:polysaccharide biosynthesis/export family protein [Sphingomicrobium nitratireducens]